MQDTTFEHKGHKVEIVRGEWNDGTPGGGYRVLIDGKHRGRWATDQQAIDGAKQLIDEGRK